MSSRAMDVTTVAARVAAQCHALRDDPARIGLYLTQEADGWRVGMQMDYPYTWPHGRGQLAYDPARFASAANAFAVLLEEAYTAESDDD